MSSILFIKIKSNLAPDEFERRVVERMTKFLDVPGLIQKIYGRDPESGDICGIYFFKDQNSLDAYRKSELAKRIPEAYDAMDVRREVFDVLFPLHPEAGPVQ